MKGGTENTTILRQLNIILMGCLVFLLPVDHSWVSPNIMLWAITAIILIIKQKKRFQFKRPNVLLMIFYLLLIAGLFWSDNTKTAGFDLEVKMSLFIFPLIFSFLEYSKKEMKLIMQCFYAGLIFTSLWLLSKASISYFSTHVIEEFFYANLSDIIHPSYLSLYFVVGFSTLLIELKNYSVKSEKKVHLKLGLAGFLFCFNILLLSKIGIIVSTLLLAYYVVRWVLINRKYKTGIAIFSSLLLIFFLSYNSSPYVKNRVDELVFSFRQKPGAYTNSSTGIRVQIWQTGIGVVKKNILFGSGTGDVKDELMDEYLKREILTAYRKKLNSHNQFLQVAIALGLVGLTLFVFIFIDAIRTSKKTGNEYMIVFAIICILYMFPESVLENQAGTIFFGLFFCLLSQSSLSFSEPRSIESTENRGPGNGPAVNN